MLDDYLVQRSMDRLRKFLSGSADGRELLNDLADVETYIETLEGQVEDILSDEGW